MRARFFYVMLSVALVLLSGCNDFKAWFAKEFKQGDLTEGIVRLSTQSLSMVTSEVSQKFSEPGVETVIEKDPNALGKGTVTKTLKNMIITHRDHEVHKDCLGNVAKWNGTVVVDATQTMTGTLTNNDEQPVIPDDDPKAVHLRISFRPTDLEIIFSNQSNNYLHLDSGTITFDVYPRLATSQERSHFAYGMRVVPTSNALFENVTYDDVKGRLYSSEVELDFDISSGNVTIQVGKGEELENYLAGSVTAFNNHRKVPENGNDLDPEYDPQKFMDTYSCDKAFKTADNVHYVAYAHTPLEEKIGPGLAGLSTMALGIVVNKLSRDHVCGMASPAFLKTTKIIPGEGLLGSTNATLPSPCTLTFDFVTEPDCFGKAHKVSGSVRVTQATKTMSGDLYVDTDADFLDSVADYEEILKSAANIAEALSEKPEAIVPRSTQPAEISVTAEFHDFSISDVCEKKAGSVTHEHHCSKASEKSLTFSIVTGEASATLRPVLAKDTDPKSRAPGMCSVPTPNTEASLRLKNFETSVTSGGFKFVLTANGTCQIVNGIVGTQENYLGGELTVGRLLLDFSKKPTKLNPFYERQKHLDSFLHCREGKVAMVKDESECIMK